MKKILCLAAGLLALNLTSVFGQQIGQPIARQINPTTGLPIAPKLTKFNLDFSGGTPAQLVAAIEKATGKPLNAIIPDEDANTQLPPLKMSDVDVGQLFNALVNMSYRYDQNQFLPGSQPAVTSSFGFETKDSAVSDNSIWYFFVYHAPAPPHPEKVCQFYSLAPYLDHGFTVDDITTAIQTGWKMAGLNPAPDLDYHKETGLLIAFGEPGQLKTINDVLGTLPQLKSEYWKQLNSNIYQLQQQVRELQKQVSGMATNAAPEEKSGK